MFSKPYLNIFAEHWDTKWEYIQKEGLQSVKGSEHPFDPELLYVECQNCGKPVLWGRGKTSTILKEAHIDASLLDAHCLILSEGCPACSEEGAPYQYSLSVVRVAEISPEDILFLNKPVGNA